jgi:hypothetical protein
VCALPGRGRGRRRHTGIFAWPMQERPARQQIPAHGDAQPAVIADSAGQWPILRPFQAFCRRPPRSLRAVSPDDPNQWDGFGVRKGVRAPGASRRAADALESRASGAEHTGFGEAPPGWEAHRDGATPPDGESDRIGRAPRSGGQIGNARAREAHHRSPGWAIRRARWSLWIATADRDDLCRDELRVTSASARAPGRLRLPSVLASRRT